jgi:hypothetical protein
MPISPPGKKTTTFIGGSPRGWTFIKTAQCWYRWFLRYFLGLVEVYTPEYFDVGSAFHALMEGRSKESVALEYPDVMKEAERLHELRLTKGPPLPPATAIEKEHALFGGYMTSKPDREEAGSSRDFKTSSHFSKYDEQFWNTDGGIIGETVATQQNIIVDIVSKSTSGDDKKAPEKPVKVVTVAYSKVKEEALRSHVEDFWWQLTERVKRLVDGVEPKSAFPKNVSQCIGDYGPCPYYAHCWGVPPESLLYKYLDPAPHRWLKSGPLPKGLTVAKVEKAREALLKRTKAQKTPSQKK